MQEIIAQDSWQRKWLLYCSSFSHFFHKSRETLLFGNFAGNTPSASNLLLLTYVGTKQHQLKCKWFSNRAGDCE